MGETFLDMFSIDPNPAGLFLDFVKGHAAVSKVMGKDAPLPVIKKKRRSAKDTIPNCEHDKGWCISLFV